MTYIRAACFATRPERPGWRGDMKDGRSGGRQVGWKRGRAEEVRQNRKEEAKQIGRRRKGRKEELTGRRKEGMVGPSSQARHSSSSLISKRYKSGLKHEGHLYGHKIYEFILYLLPDRYSGVAQRLPKRCARTVRRSGTAQHHRGGIKRAETW